jgi:LCP family protein required for cell wall assembly
MARPRLRWTRTTGQRVLIGVNIGLITLLTISAAGLWYTAQKLADVERLDVAGELTAASEARTVTAADIVVLDPATVAANVTSTTEVVPTGPPQNYLIVGSDNAEDLDADSLALNGRDGEVANNLADTIMVVRTDPAAGVISVLSIPRDLEVTVAGSGSVQKINAAFNYTEPHDDRVVRLVNTVEENLDIGVQHYVEVDLAAFQRIVDAIGGVDVCFAGPTNNPRTGLLISEPGWVRLDGETALQYVRSRSELVAQNSAGQWISLSGRGDLDRIERQQTFVREAIDQTAADISTSPALLLDVLDIAADELVVSNSFSVVSDGRNLASWFSGIDDDSLFTDSLDVVDLPKNATRTDDRLGFGPGAEAQLDIFRGINPLDVVAKRIDLTVLGLNRVTVSDALNEVDFVAVPRPTESGGELVIRYGIGGHQAANLVAAYLDATVDFVADDSLFGHEIILELGSVAPQVLAAPRALTKGAPEIVVDSTPTTVDGETTSTTTAEEPYWPFDCDAPRDSDG